MCKWLVSVEDILESELSRTYLGRASTPDDIARAVAFLASDDASWVTSQMLNVCARLTIHDGNDFESLAGSSATPQSMVFARGALIATSAGARQMGAHH